MITTHCERGTDVELNNDKQNITDKFAATPKNVNHQEKTLRGAQHQQKISTQIASFLTMYRRGT